MGEKELLCIIGVCVGEGCDHVFIRLSLCLWTGICLVGPVYGDGNPLRPKKPPYKEEDEETLHKVRDDETLHWYTLKKGKK